MALAPATRSYRSPIGASLSGGSMILPERGLLHAGSPQPRFLARGIALALAAEIADVTGGVAVA